MWNYWCHNLPFLVCLEFKFYGILLSILSVSLVKRLKKMKYFPSDYDHLGPVPDLPMRRGEFALSIHIHRYKSMSHWTMFECVTSVYPFGLHKRTRNLLTDLSQVRLPKWICLSDISQSDFIPWFPVYWTWLSSQSYNPYTPVTSLFFQGLIHLCLKTGWIILFDVFNIRPINGCTLVLSISLAEVLQSFPSHLSKSATRSITGYPNK